MTDATTPTLKPMPLNAEKTPSVIVHRLHVNPDYPPIRQKKRVFTQERDKAVAEEVKKLLEARFIREVYYPD